MLILFYFFILFLQFDLFLNSAMTRNISRRYAGIPGSISEMIFIQSHGFQVTGGVWNSC
jgi:hypothetical protein